MSEKITQIGAGLAGPLLATNLARLGYHVDIYERRPDMRIESNSAGRSINLALSARGINALKEVRIYDQIKPLTIPMKGRMIHDMNGSTHLQPYGQRKAEVIRSISREQLNKQLMTLAESTGKVKIHFNKKCTNVDLDKESVTFKDTQSDETTRIQAELIIGVDGSASAVRGAMVVSDKINFTYEPLEHGYKELTMPPDSIGNFQMEPKALHVWPRGQFMLIALPNLNKTFTCTLFFPLEGPLSFETVIASDDVIKLFEDQFPDALGMMPGVVEEFLSNPVGKLGTVFCDPWHVGSQALLMGDAAHAVVPFFGQGMNASFQDCSLLRKLINKHSGDWAVILSEFSRIHVKNGHSIAKMAIENYLEMRDHVNDPIYKKRRKLELKMERMFPDEFIPRYSMVSFHQTPYSEVYKRGEKQHKIIEAMLKNFNDISEIDEISAQDYLQVPSDQESI